MNSLEKEVLKLSLEQEKAILKEIEEQYERAMEEVKYRISYLEARYKAQGLQSIVYQLKYQKAIRAQIWAILDDLKAKQYTSIMDYLQNCYRDGFTSILYYLQAQDIPLVFPIDQEKMVRAIMTESKISDGLYKKLGMDVDELKKEISREVSRGISNNLPYEQIASFIDIRGDVCKHKSFRIVRTEGHRIQEAAKFDAQLEAKENGARIVKQWDATLDKRTRRSHAELDGQIREVDEAFTYGNYKAMYPGNFNVAKLDINCRCTMLQRATFELDEEEIISKTKEGKLIHIKSKDYQNFKDQYFGLTEKR